MDQDVERTCCLCNTGSKSFYSAPIKGNWLLCRRVNKIAYCESIQNQFKERNTNRISVKEYVYPFREDRTDGKNNTPSGAVRKENAVRNFQSPFTTCKKPIQGFIKHLKKPEVLTAER